MYAQTGTTELLHRPHSNCELQHFHYSYSTRVLSIKTLFCSGRRMQQRCCIVKPPLQPHYNMAVVETSALCDFTSFKVQTSIANSEISML